MSWLEKIMPSIGKNAKKNIPEGLWSKCPECNRVLYQEELERLLYVCPKCNHHLRISARRRIQDFLDMENQVEIAPNIQSVDPLKFKDQKKYKDRYQDAQKKTKEKDALIAKSGFLKGMPIVTVAFDFSFMGGSMGSVVGEKFVRAAHLAIKNNQPLVCFSASGGARMQEGLFSLMQMSKTSLAVKLLSDNKIPFISVLTDPTMGVFLLVLRCSVTYKLQSQTQELVLQEREWLSRRFVRSYQRVFKEVNFCLRRVLLI